jgi:hypothetical protein
MKPTTEYTLTLRPLPDVDGIKALRAALKVLLRRYGLRAVKISPSDADDTSPSD